MKILIITQYFWPENFRINDLAIDLKNRGHEVSVLTGIPNYPEGTYFPGYGLFKKKREIFNKIKVLRVPLISRGYGRGLRLILNYLSFAFFASLIGPFICREKYDVIFVYEPSPITVGLPALVLKVCKRAPILFWVQDLWPESLVAAGFTHSKHILTCAGALTKFIYSGCERILVQSKAFISFIEKQGVPRNKIFYFPNAAEDLYKFTLSKQIATEEHWPKGFSIVYAGNIGVSQSFETILAAAEALKSYQDIHWIVIGEGRQKDWLVRQIQSRGLNCNIHLLGRKPVETMPYYFAKANALLVTLRKDPIFELTIPSKLQSYLACGKPIIAAIDGEAQRIITESKAGLVGSADDIQALANNVLAMYNAAPRVLEEMGRNGSYYFAIHFEKQYLLQQLETWMREVVEG